MIQLELALCATGHRRKRDRLALCQIVITDGNPPEWIQLVPAGTQVNALDGRSFSNSNPQAVVEAFEAHGLDLPIDWEHSTEIKAPEGDEAPAAAWIVAMEVRDGAIFGRVSWTDDGAASVVARKYRYISPAFTFEKGSKIVAEIVSAGLTNRPALDMPELSHNDPDVRQAHTEDIMDPKLLEALGLPADATAEQVTAATIKLAADKAELAAAATPAPPADPAVPPTPRPDPNPAPPSAPEVPSLANFVPRADYDVALARAKKAEDDEVARLAAERDSTIETEITAAMEEGKITPASKGFYLASCRADGGIERFREFVKTAPVIGDPSPLDNRPPPAQGTGDELSASEIEVMNAMGQTVEQFKASKKELTERGVFRAAS